MTTGCDHDETTALDVEAGRAFVYMLVGDRLACLAARESSRVAADVALLALDHQRVGENPLEAAACDIVMCEKPTLIASMPSRLAQLRCLPGALAENLKGAVLSPRLFRYLAGRQTRRNQ